jgi:hypothetical protein
MTMPPSRSQDGAFLYTAEIVLELLCGRSVVSIEYRVVDRRIPRGPRHRFLLVPDEGESFESVAAKIEPAITAHNSEPARVEIEAQSRFSALLERFVEDHTGERES